MNVFVEMPVPLKDAHHQAIEQVNAWRGRCVNLFARGENIIGKALLAQPDPKSMPMLLSQRNKRLTAIVDGDTKKTAALEAFQLIASRRNAIVHGNGKVYVAPCGHWLLRLEMIDRSGVVTEHFTKAEADAHAKELKKAIDDVWSAFQGQSANDGSSR